MRTWRTECSRPVATPQTYLAPMALSDNYVVCIIYDQSEILLSPGILPKDWIFLPQCCYDGIHNTDS
jgi:hypothetical protein